jgi:ankyrin repeat protein
MFLDKPLFHYSATGNAIELEKLLAGSGINIHEVNEEGNNALILAAMNNHPATVKLLLEAGSFFHSTNRYGHNALIVAAMRCHSEVVKIIIEHSKKVSDRTSPSIVALMCANSLESQGCNDVAEMLRNNPC